MHMSHMLADTDAELRAMADAIGMQQRWHQGDHFDINDEMRAIALARGAIAISKREAVVVRRKFRETFLTGISDRPSLSQSSTASDSRLPTPVAK